MRHSRLWPLALLVILIGSLVSLGFTIQRQHESIRGWEVATTPDSSLPFALPKPGVNAELTQYTAEMLDTQLDDMRRLGIVWVRQVFPWAKIEPERGVFDWTPWDRIVDAFRARPDMQLVAVLTSTPVWARLQVSAPLLSPPADTSDFGRFVGVFAERYGDIINYYEAWDEPNLGAAWGGLPPSAVDYVALLQSAYTAIHETDGDAMVITAGLAPTTEQGPQNYSDLLFLRAIYENGGQPYFDAVAGKPYGFNTGPDDRRVQEEILNFSRLILLREEMVRHGDSEKALWGAQFGWNALPADWQGAPSLWGEQTREEQLTFIREAYHRAAQEWPWAGGLILEHWQPAVSEQDPLWGFSLIRPGETRINVPDDLFGRSEQAAQPGRYPPDSRYVHYTGDWTFDGLGADIGQSGNSEASFTFNGTEVALEVRRGNYRGYIFVTVDGQPANALPRDSVGNGYIILTSDDLSPHTDVILVAHDLEPGIHQLHLHGELGWGQWSLAGYRVAERPDSDRYQITVIGLIMLSLFSGVALIVLRRHLILPAGFREMRRVAQRLQTPGQLVLAGVASVLVMVGMLLTLNDSLTTILRRDPPGLLLGIVSAGLLYFSPWLVVTLAAAGILWLLIYQRLELGLLLTIFWAPFFLFPVKLYQFAIPMVEICLLLTATAWALHWAVDWANRRKTGSKPASSMFVRWMSRFNSLDWGVLFLLGIATLSISWSAHQHEALRELRTMILEPAVFYLLLRTTIRSREEVKRLVDTFMLATVVVVTISLWMYINGRGIITAEGGSRRLSGIYGSPNNIALLIDRALPFAIAYILTATNRRRRAVVLPAGGVMLLGAFLSQSAGAILLGVPAGIAVVIFLWNWRRAVIATLAAGGAGALALIPLSHHPRFARLTDFSAGTSFFRLRLWQSAITMIRERPIRGYGLDQFLYAYRGRYILPEAWQEPSLSHPHNIVLDFWTRLGIGGLLLLIWLQAAFWQKCWHLYRLLPARSVLRTLIIGTMGSMGAVLIHGLVDNSVFVLDLSYVFVLLLAIPSLIHAAGQVDANS